MIGSNSVGAVNLDVKLNSKPAERQIGGISSRLARGLKVGLAGAIAGIGAFSVFSKKCIDLGSDLAEVQNVVDVTFGSMSGAVDKWAKDAATSFGLSETMAKRYVGTFGSMAEAFGFSEQEAYDMSTALTGLAGDVASFYNISQDAAYTKLKSVFSGETEALKDLGIVMTQANLDQYALANGFGKTTSAMTEAEKVSLRYAFIQDQLANATGDFARTSDSWANQTRILNLQIESLMANIGQGLIAVLTPAIRALNAFMAKLVQASETFKNFIQSVFTKTKIGNAFNKSLGGTENAAKGASISMDDLGESSGSTGKAAKKAAKDLKKAQRELLGFDKITKLAAKHQNEGTSGDSGIGSLSGGGGLGSGDMAALSSQADEANKALSKIKIPPKLSKSLKHLKKSLGTFFGIIKSAGKWAWENVLKPLGKWTISEAVPAVIDILAGAFDVLNGILLALKPVWKWVWEHLFKPLAKLAGKAIVFVLEGIAGAFELLGKAIEKHPKLTATIVIIAGAFFGLIKAGGVAGILGKIGGAFQKLGGILFKHPIALLITAIAVAIGYIYKNWDKIKKTKFGKALIKIGKALKPVWEFLKKIGKLLAEKLLKTIGKVVAAIKTFKDIWNGIKDKAVELVAEAKEKVAGAIGKIREGWEAIKDKGAELKAAVATKWSDIKAAWNNLTDNIQDKTAEMKAKVGTLWSDIKDTWHRLTDHIENKTAEMKAKVGTVWSNIKDRWHNIVDKIKDKTATMKAVVKNALGGAYKTCKKAWDFFKDKTATLKAAFVDTLSGPLKRMWNGVASGINTGIGVINKIPGVNIPKLPYLAQGGFVARNTPRLAVIGDNRREGEIVSPESKLQDMALQAAKMAGGSRDGEIVTLLRALLTAVNGIDPNVYMDSEKVSKKVVGVINQKTRATGKSPIWL